MRKSSVKRSIQMRYKYQCPSLEHIHHHWSAFFQNSLKEHGCYPIGHSPTIPCTSDAKTQNWQQKPGHIVGDVCWSTKQRPDPLYPLGGIFKNGLVDAFLHHTFIIKSRKTYKSLVDFHALCVGWVMDGGGYTDHLLVIHWSFMYK